MVHLRATHKVLRSLGPAASSSDPPDTALGDWFVNRFVVARRPLLLLVSSASLLAILEPARGVRSLPERLPSLVGRRLRRLGVPDRLIQAEIDAMDEVRVAPTNDRSVVGTMVDFVHQVHYYGSVAERWNESSLAALEDALERMPCRVTRSMSETVWPDRRTRELLAGEAEAGR